MSTPPARPPFDDYDDDDLEPRRGGHSTVTKVVAGVAATAMLAFGASTALSKNGSSTSSAATSPAGQVSTGPGGPGGGRGFGTPVTGDTLTKLKAVVTAKYAGSSVEQAMQRQDGSYEVHVLQSNGTEVHVLVSKALKITGTEQGGAGRGGMGTPVTGDALTRLKAAVGVKYAGASIERANTLP